MFFVFFFYPIYVVQWRLGTRLVFQPSFCAMLHHITFVSPSKPFCVMSLCSLVCFYPHSPPCLHFPINRLLLSTCHPHPLLYFHPSSFTLHPFFHVHCRRRPLALPCFPLALSPPPVLLALFLLLCMKWVVCTTSPLSWKWGKNRKFFIMPCVLSPFALGRCSGFLRR